MHKIAHNLTQVQNRIQAAAKACGRNPQGITLLAVSKTHPPEAVAQAYEAGHTAFGENYLQEALSKQAQLAELPLSWHFLGPVQSNKCRALAESFDWLHTLADLRHAQRLSQARPSQMAPLNVCIQVNIDAAPSKSGVTPAQALGLCQGVEALPGLCLRGLMAIPDPEHPGAFADLAALFAAINPQLARPMDTLSMGMSDDLELAIAQGSTLVRIGTAIFGARQTPPSP